MTKEAQPERQVKGRRKHAHYFKDVTRIEEIDVYRVLHLFSVTDQCFGHAIKKLLVAGGRGDKAIVSTLERDVQEAIDTLVRWQEMRAEDGTVVGPSMRAVGTVC